MNPKMQVVEIPHALSNVHDVHYVHGRLGGTGEVERDGWATTALSEEKVSHSSRVVV